jgi:hypothetical protein
MLFEYGDLQDVCGRHEDPGSLIDLLIASGSDVKDDFKSYLETKRSSLLELACDCCPSKLETLIGAGALISRNLSNRMISAIKDSSQEHFPFLKACIARIKLDNFDLADQDVFVLLQLMAGEHKPPKSHDVSTLQDTNLSGQAPVHPTARNGTAHSSDVQETLMQAVKMDCPGAVVLLA